MKKKVLLLVSLVLVLGLFAASPVASEESELYYTNVTILKIFPHRLGYYVIYRRPSSLTTGELFIPLAWFDRRDQRAVLNQTEANINPYLSIITKKGEFDHVRITVMKDITHSSWGTLPNPSLYDDKFNVEKLTLDY